MATTDKYFISAKLKSAVINFLTGMVLDIYKMHDQAQVFYEKAKQE